MESKKIELFEKYESLKNAIIGDFLCLEKYRFENPALVYDIVHETVSYIQREECNAIPDVMAQALAPFCPQCSGDLQFSDVSQAGHCTNCERRGL